MKKVLFLTTMFCAALMVQAQRPQMMRMAEPGLTDQTARKFTIDLTDDGKAQMVCFLPTTASGKAIVGVPGGGYSVLSNTHEGTMAADWLNKKGIAYFVVNYRMPEGDRNIPIAGRSCSIPRQAPRECRDSPASDESPRTDCPPGWDADCRQSFRAHRSTTCTADDGAGS